MRTLPYSITQTRKDGTSRTFMIRACVPEDLEAILALQEDVRAGVEDQATFAVMSRAQVKEMLEYDRVYCAEVIPPESRQSETARHAHPVMVGLTAMMTGRMSEYHQGVKLGYDEARIRTCVTMEVTFIDAAFRGYGIQQIFFGLREEVARELGAREALTTISPDNEYSLANAIRSGYTVVKEVELYGGLRRYILRKEFDEQA